MNPDDWLCCYSADETEADAYRLAIVKLGVPEDAVEVLWTDGHGRDRRRQNEPTGNDR